LYWRVRANDTNGANEGLNWSPIQSFRRTLPVPAPSAGNPTSSEAIPALSFTPVVGATAYNVHVEEPNGSSKDFAIDSTAFTPTEWTGAGIWRWSVRAQFPSTGGSVTSSYFASQPIVHLFAAPTGVSGVKSGSRIVIAWNPDAYAKEYEVQISTSDTFRSTIESRRVQGTSWAPDIDLTQPANRGTLFWRVAAKDQQGNLSPFATGSFVAPSKPAPCKIVKVKVHGKTVKRCVRGAKKKH
jgi:hypothetical protein